MLARVAMSGTPGAVVAKALLAQLVPGAVEALAGLGGSWISPYQRRRPPAQEDLTGTYVTLNEYVGDWDAMPEGVDSPEALTRHLLREHDPEKLLWSLARMNWLSSRTGNPPGLVEEYREHLPESWRPAFDRTMRMRNRRGLGRIVAARQPILAGMREVLTSPPELLTGEAPASLSTAVMLSHAVGARLEGARDVEEGEHPDEPFLVGFPKWAHRAMIGHSLLGTNVDLVHAIFRTLSLWRDWGPRLEKYQMEKEPAEMLRDATGMVLEDILAVGLMMYGYEDTWVLGRAQMTARLDESADLTQDALDRFLRLVTATRQDLRRAFDGRTGPFDFFPLQGKPVIRLGDDLVVVDRDFLLERVTSGLYWSVFDYVKQRLPDPSKLPRRWTQAFGEMFELSVEEQLQAMAPSPSEGRRTVYTEEDLKEAYGEGTKRPDVTVYYGRFLVLFEIVSGRLKSAARSQGDLDAFADDLKEKVLKKFGQLDDASRRILDDETRLTGRSPTPNLRILPVVVQADLFPSDALSLELLERLAHHEGFFRDRKIARPSVIDATELDMLEGLRESKGVQPPEALGGWKGLPKKIALRNYLLWKHGNAPGTYQSSRMANRVETGLGEMLRRAAQQMQSRATQDSPPEDA